MENLIMNGTMAKPQPKVKPETMVKPETITLPETKDEMREKLNSLFASVISEPKIRIITKRQILNESLKWNVMGLGSWYSAIVKDEINTLAFLADQKSKGKKFDPVKVNLLFSRKSEGFNLFKKYLNEKEIEKHTFTANQATGIFLRACLLETV